jgi:hypothetical protein
VTIKRITWILFGLSLFCFVALAALYVWYQASQNSFALELAKSVLQVLVVFVLGTVGAILTDSLSNERAQSEKRREEQRRIEGNRDELRKNLMERLNRSYSDFKRAKRLLRARAFAPPYYDESDLKATVNLEQYDELLGLLNEAQLEMEQIRRDVRAVPKLFDNWEAIATAIEAMEESLNQVIREYETKRGEYDENNPPKISDLPALADVVGTSANAKNLVQISNRYRDAARRMQQRIAQSYD